MGANLTTPEATRLGHFHTTRDGTVVSASSDIAPSGPRRCAGGKADRWRYTPERASRHTRQTAAKP